MSKTVVVSTLAAGLFAAGLAGVLQISTVLVLALKMRPVQYVGAFLVSTIFGGGLTVIFLEQLHLNAFLAGVFGSFSGALPAVLVPLIVMRTALKRLGVTDADLSQLFNAVQEMQDRTQQDSQKGAPDGPARP